MDIFDVFNKSAANRPLLFQGPDVGDQGLDLVI